MNDYEAPAKTEESSDVNLSQVPVRAASRGHHQRAGHAAVRRILDASGEEMRVQSGFSLSPGALRQTMVERLRQAGEAVDDGLSAVFQRFKGTNTTVSDKAWELAGNEVFGHLRELLTGALFKAIPALGAAVAQTKKIGGWLEAIHEAGVKQAEDAALLHVIELIKIHVRQEINIFSTAVMAVPDEDVISFGETGFLEPIWTAAQVAQHVWLILEERLRSHLTVAEQVDRMHHLGEDLTALGKIP